MGREEQQEEREVLDSIFPEEITDVSETEYRISMELDIPTRDDEDEPPVILLNVRYGEAYPDEAPMLDITAPPNAPRHEHLDIQEDKAQLLQALEPTIEENMGMAMVFTLYSTLKDEAESLIVQRQNAVNEAHEKELRKAEEEENRKFEGAKVTPESFKKWQADFKQEMAELKQRQKEQAEAEEKKKNKGKTEEKKMSGRQIFEQGLAGKGGEDEEDEGEDAITEDMRKVKVEG
ncbi:hypothetical protein Q7P37_001416 [Cladosporium fusiforme]